MVYSIEPNVVGWYLYQSDDGAIYKVRTGGRWNGVITPWYDVSVIPGAPELPDGSIHRTFRLKSIGTNPIHRRTVFSNLPSGVTSTHVGIIVGPVDGVMWQLTGIHGEVRTLVD